MVTMDEAKLIVLGIMEKGTTITAEIKHNADYLFFAIRPDVLEGRFDPFVKVNSETGEFSDWSPHDYDDSLDILNKLNASKGGN